MERPAGGREQQLPPKAEKKGAFTLPAHVLTLCLQHLPPRTSLTHTSLVLTAAANNRLLAACFHELQLRVQPDVGGAALVQDQLQKLRESGKALSEDRYAAQPPRQSKAG
jgi:hypothetical protein